MYYVQKRKNYSSNNKNLNDNFAETLNVSNRQIDKRRDNLGLKHFFIVILAFLSLLVIGCSTNAAKESENIEHEIFPSMTGRIIINGKEYKMAQGGYQWTSKKGFETETMITDHASPNQMAAQIESIIVDPNQIINIQVEDDPQINIYLWNELEIIQEIEPTANQIAVPSSKGRYIYEVSAKWAKGTISYTFVVEIL